jgi:Uma2 family endonuclease
MPQGKHSVIQTKLIIFINSLLLESNIAIALSELRCTFGGRSIVPDIVVLKNENIPKDDDGEVANVVATAPDWTIEILSPDQSFVGWALPSMLILGVKSSILSMQTVF